MHAQPLAILLLTSPMVLSPPSPQILVVDADRAALALLVSPLKMAGFAVTMADDFEDAVGLLKGHGFHAVVTAHRLGAHNGLHLVLRARSERPEVIIIVTSPKSDPVLDSEASAFGAQCVVAPWNDPAPLVQLLGSTGAQLA